MKKAIFLLISLPLLFSCNSQEKYTIEGELTGIDQGKVFLQKRESGKFVKVDSAAIQDGAFQITDGMVEYPQMYYLSVEGKRGYLNFFLENSDILISGNADSLYYADVDGSATQAEYDEYNKGLEPYYEENSSLFMQSRAARQEGDEEKAEELDAQREEIFEEINDYNIEYIKANPASYTTPVVLSSVTYGMSGDELESYVEQLDPRLHETQAIIDMKERVEKLKKVGIGQIAPDFTQNDPEGNPVSLSDVLGPELLLIDFWAAWCGPCRAENPNVVAVYQDYHDKGFDVLGVSLDREKEDWLKAIEDDNLTWTHVSDLAYWDNEAADLYAVRAIPANFLVDSEGRILATNLRGEDLRKTVADHLE